MKINEVEALVGVTKKNIRFYEEQGLLSPRRNSENGYREYCEEDVAGLRRIKLMRKLGVPIAEIRQMQSGELTVGDAMRRHLVTLEREEKSIRQSIRLCEMLKTQEGQFDTLDAAAVLCEMEQLERSGAVFHNKQQEDIRTRRYVSSVTACLVMIVLMVALLLMMVWGIVSDPEAVPPLPLLLLFFAIPMVLIVGVLLALRQRIGEIRKGEIDDATRY